MIGWLIFFALSLASLLLAFKLKNRVDFEPILSLDLNRIKIPLKIPILYAILFKSKIGIKQCDTFVKKHRKFVGLTKWPVIISGFFFMISSIILIVWILLDNVFKAFAAQETTQAVAMILPVDISSKAVIYVPFFYWIIAIFIVATIHEFGHAIYVRYFNIPIESTGIGLLCLFIPGIPVFYVKPEEDKLKELQASEKLLVYSAGGSFNIITSFIFFFFLIIFGAIGVMFGFLAAAVPAMEGQVIAVVIFNALFHIYAFSLGIGMMNLFPIIPLDGGLMLKTISEKFRWADWTWKIGSLMALGLLLATFFVPFLITKFIGI